MSRLLAIDYGTKRAGLAVTDPLKIIATALDTIHPKDLILYLKKYDEKEGIEAFVIGMPKTLSNEESTNAQHVRGFVKKLKTEFPGKEIHQVDERFTSSMALDAMISGGMKKKDRRIKGNTDKISACIILQSFLETKKQTVKNMSFVFTVIISTKNNPERLKKSLDRICPCFQTLDGSFYEVLICDHSDNELTQQMVETKFGWGKWIKSPGKYFSSGRNQLAEFAQGEYLIFIPDYFIPFDSWLEDVKHQLDNNKQTQMMYDVLPEESGKTDFFMINKNLFISNGKFDEKYQDNPLQYSDFFTSVKHKITHDQFFFKRHTIPTDIHNEDFESSKLALFLSKNSSIIGLSKSESGMIYKKIKGEKIKYQIQKFNFKKAIQLIFR